MRYVELNPVRAGLVTAAADYAWSSAVKHLAGPDTMGLPDLAGWSAGWSAEEWAEMLCRDDHQASAIREATYAGRPLGSEGLSLGWSIA